MSGFGLIGRLEFLQNIASWVVSQTPGPIIHNVDKYNAIKKCMYLLALDGKKGDYLEFGVFTGSSFCHALRCSQASTKIWPGLANMRFYGFDAFGGGFERISGSEAHQFYVSENFDSDYTKVLKRVKKTARSYQSFKLIKGLFEETLSGEVFELGVSECSLIFIDSDTYSSAKAAFEYSKASLGTGTIIILDDYFSYSGDPDLGVSKAFEEFKTSEGFTSRQIFTYGMGGVVHILKKVAP